MVPTRKCRQRARLSGWCLVALCLLSMAPPRCNSQNKSPLSPASGTGGKPDFSNLCDTNHGGHCTVPLTLSVGGMDRSYLLHIPPHYQFNVAPLVIFLHGTGNSASYSESSTRLDTTADENGFAIAYANAAQRNLNFPVWSIFFSDPIPGAPDDVAFLRALIQDLQGKIHPDPKRIYVVGFSIGAAMAQRAGVELSDLVAAIASVEGMLKTSWHGEAKVPPAAHPVSVLILHADRADDMVPYCGGPNVQFKNWNFDSQEDVFNYWSGRLVDHCQRLSPNASLCDSSGNITPLLTKSATDCADGTEVRLYRIKAGAHDWWASTMNDPAREPYNPDLNATTGITTNDIVWRFFAAHPKK